MTHTDEQLLTLTKQLMAIESVAKPTGGTKNLHKAYEFIVQMLTASGKDITVEHFRKNGFPSLLAYKGPRRPDNFRIILNAHVDVVAAKKQQFQAEEKDGRLYGRGTHDMKAAAVILTDVFCEFVDKAPYALGLQIVTDEEVAGYDGAAYQVAQGVRADFVICGECGRREGTHEIANEAKGVALIELEFDGRAAHGAYLWRGNNAILRATKFAHAILERYPVPTEEAHHTTVNISNIATKNMTYTSVPDHAFLRLEIRFTHEDPNFRSKQHVAALIEEIDPGARISAMPSFEAPVYTSPKNPLLKQLKVAAEKVESHDFKLVRRHATSDGRHFANVGDQACEFGIAGEDQHGDNENITIKAFQNYRKTMQMFLASTIKTEKHNVNTVAYNATHSLVH